MNKACEVDLNTCTCSHRMAAPNVVMVVKGCVHVQTIEDCNSKNPWCADMMVLVVLWLVFEFVVPIRSRGLLKMAMP